MPRWRWSFLAGLALGLVCAGGTSGRPSSPCDLEPWLLADPFTDRGYHVLCVAAGQATVYANGAAEGSLDGAWTLHVGPGFAANLEVQLGLRRDFSFQPSSGNAAWRSGALRWAKPTWALFMSSGERVEPGAASSRLSDYEGVLLLFEGGCWRWPAVRLGYERIVLPGVVLRTLALRPALFELVFQGRPDGGREALGVSDLGPALLERVVEMAEPSLQRSMVEGKAKPIRTSFQAAFAYRQTVALQQLRSHTEALLRIPGSHFEENLQVLRYSEGQLYAAHRDYWDPREFPDAGRFLHPQTGSWFMRHATVLWFLKAPGVGGDTWFPRAHGGDTPYNEWTACDDRGVKVGGRNGTIAILFYSLHSNGEIDEFSWHCGCPVIEGVKWAANSWIWNQPFPGSAAPAHGPQQQNRGEGKDAQHTDYTRLRVTFENLYDQEAELLWVDMQSGNEIQMATVLPGASQPVDAGAGHSFRYKIAGQIRGSYTVQASLQEQVVHMGPDKAREL